MPESDRVLKVLLGITIAALLLPAFFTVFQTPELASGSATIDASTAGHTTLDTTLNEIPGSVTVEATTGRAIALTGASDSFVESDAPVTLASDGTWTVCTWAEVDSGAASETMTALSANGRAIIEYNGTAGNWSGWYYDDGSRNSYRVDVSAPNQPGNLTNTCLRHNGTHLSIYRNNTQGEIVNATQSNIASASVNASNWDGRLEEARIFDDALSSSERQQLVDSPVRPLPGTNRTARLMFDEGEGTTTAMYFAATDATLSNATWVAGFADPGMSRGTDYELGEHPFSIRIIAGGFLDGAPVEHVSWSDGSPLPGVLNFPVVGGTILLLIIIHKFGEEINSLFQ